MSNTISNENTPIKLCYLTLKYGGVMNLENRPWSLIITAYHQIMINIFGVAAALEILIGNQSLLGFVQALSAFMVYVQVISKSINMQLRQIEIRQLLERLESIRVEILKDQRMSRYLIEAESFAKKCIIIFGASLFSFPFAAFFTYFGMDYLSNFTTPHLMHKVWLPWRLTDIASYLAGTVLVSMTILSTMFYYVPFSAVQFTFTMQLSALVKILQYNLENRGPTDRLVFDQHQTIIELIRQYNHIFSGQIYLEILVSPIQPCGFAYALIKILESFDLQAVDLLYKIFMCLSAPYVICACGQELSTQVEKLHEFSYLSNWYEEKPAIRTNLLTMMIVTLKPIEINYKKMVSFNYICFASVMQGIYSYIMLIINLESKK